MLDVVELGIVVDGPVKILFVRVRSNVLWTEPLKFADVEHVGFLVGIDEQRFVARRERVVHKLVTVLFAVTNDAVPGLLRLGLGVVVGLDDGFGAL